MKQTNLQRGIAPLIIVLIIAAVVAVGGGTYYSKQKEKKMAENGEFKTEMGANADASAKLNVNTQGTLRNLLAVGRDVVCTVDGSQANGGVSGTVYISGNMMRGDFTSTASGQGSADSHMIRNGDVTYVWSGSQGAKMDLGSMNANNSSQAEGNLDLDKQVNYKCSDWNKDSSKFNTPSDVNFVDLKAMMQGATPTQINVQGTLKTNGY